MDKKEIKPIVVDGMTLFTGLEGLAFVITRVSLFTLAGENNGSNYDGGLHVGNLLLSTGTLKGIQVEDISKPVPLIGAVVSPRKGDDGRLYFDITGLPSANFKVETRIVEIGGAKKPSVIDAQIKVENAPPPPPPPNGTGFDKVKQNTV